MSRWAIAPVFQLFDIRREPGLSPVGYQFVSREDSYDVLSSDVSVFFRVSAIRFFRYNGRFSLHRRITKEDRNE